MMVKVLFFRLQKPMAEILISLETDKFYHIYNHAISKENFFESDADYNWFLEKLRKYVVPLCEVYAFCLMPNHFHFVLRIKNEKEVKNVLNERNIGRMSIEEKMQKDEGYLANAVSQQFGNLFNAYAKYFNYVHQRKGTLFTRAFRRKWIESEDYLKQLICYMHQNPVQAGYVMKPTAWKYSSYNAIVSLRDTLVMRKEVIEYFDTVENFIFCNSRNVDLDFD
jgi:REP element-mobilizing transposase RayT